MVRVRRSKTDQLGEGADVAIPFGSQPEVCPVRAVEVWCEAAGVQEGVLLRSVDWHGRVGALLSAVTIFGLGRALGRYRVQRFAGRRVAHLSRRIAQRGFWAILIVRLLPIAPFSMVNLVAGATSLSLRDFLLGTALGMSPGIVLMSAFVDRLAEALRNPSPVAFGVLGLLMAAAWSVAWYVSRR